LPRGCQLLHPNQNAVKASADIEGAYTSNNA
jgi:hypothetical protein